MHCMKLVCKKQEVIEKTQNKTSRGGLSSPPIILSKRISDNLALPLDIDCRCEYKHLELGKYRKDFPSL